MFVYILEIRIVVVKIHVEKFVIYSAKSVQAFAKRSCASSILTESKIWVTMPGDKNFTHTHRNRMVATETT